MKYSDLTAVNEKAPQSGWMLIYLRKSVVFKSYSSLDEVSNETGSNEILEIHLFDQKKEYRAIVSESERYQDRGGVIEHLADFEYVPECVYCEKALPDAQNAEEEKVKRISVLNHLKYDENGMSVIDDYRLVVEV